jgi:hypothetical protein
MTFTITLTRTRIAIAATLVAMAGAGAAIAATDGPNGSAAVGPRTLIASPANSPVDFPGVRAARQGKPLPTGYVAVAHDVSITRGETTIYPTFTLRCPKGKRLKTFAAFGRLGPQIVGRSPFVRRRAFQYRNKPDWGVVVDFNRKQTPVGATVQGTVYGLCR